MTVEALSDRQKQDLRDLLLRRRRVLAQTLERELHTESGDAVQATGASDADWTTADVDADLALTRLERDQNELNAVERALTRIQDDDYGICESCGAAIGYARLLAHPTATRCLACQEKREATAKVASTR
ncbi:MAG: TraR/DksA family transcriptional regulator [Casimicrobium sp.]